MRNIITLVQIIFILFIGVVSHADVIRQCGVYIMEGHLEVENQTKYFLINRYSHSEIRVTLPSSSGIDGYLDGPVKVEVRIDKQCQFECTSSYIKVLEKLDPFLRPKNPFYPRQTPIKIESCSN